MDQQENNLYGREVGNIVHFHDSRADKLPKFRQSCPSVLSENALTQAIICVKQYSLRSVNIQQDSIQNVILETSGNKIPLVLSGLFFLSEDPEPPPRE